MMPDQASPYRGVTFIVRGTPAPQGSKRAFVAKGRAIMTEDNRRSAPWRDSVSAAAAAEMDGALPIDGAVEVSVTFYTVRPASVKPAKRPFPSVKPDVDKLARAVLDGLTAGGVFTDDSRVVDLHAKKRYATVASAEITVREVAA